MVDLELLDIVGMIYDAAMDPSLWFAAVDAIRARLGFFNSMMTLADLETARAIVSVQVNVPAQYSNATSPAHIAAIMALWGGLDAVSKHVVEEPIVLSDVADPTQIEDNLYYRDFAEPQGIFDVTAVALVRDRKLAGDLAFGRHRSAGRVSAAQLGELRLLAPHIRRAALISGILDTKGAVAETFESTIEATPAGVVLVDAQMRVVHANGAASRMFLAGDPIELVAGGLALRSELLKGQLAAAVASAAEGAFALGRRGMGISAQRRDGTPLVVHVMPLSKRRPELRLMGDAVAAVFIAQSDGGARVGDALGMLFGLTPMQARVFELVAGGQSSRQVAEALGIAPSTFKSHLLQVYDKTGRNSRNGLAALSREIFP